VLASGLVGSTDCTSRAAQGTPTQSHISPSIQVYEDNRRCPLRGRGVHLRTPPGSYSQTVLHFSIDGAPGGPIRECWSPRLKTGLHICVGTFTKKRVSSRKFCELSILLVQTRTTPHMNRVLPYSRVGSRVVQTLLRPEERRLNPGKDIFLENLLR